MDHPKRARLYLDQDLRRRLAAGKHNFLGHLQGTLADAGWTVTAHPDTEVERLKSRTRRGFGAFHMQPPTGPQGVCFRRAYVYPFWRIERSEKRWEFSVAKQSFDAGAIDPGAATEFVDRTRARVFPWMKKGSNPAEIVFVPLQGRLLVQRSFQSCAPIEMLSRVLRELPHAPIVVTLHPGEVYSTEETRTLHGLIQKYPNARLGDASAETLLPHARMVVTQNSSVAFTGFFQHIPAVLFAKSDFHHIAAPDFTQALANPPDFDRYLYWFLQENALNAGRGDIRDRIAGRLRELGWPI